MTRQYEALRDNLTAFIKSRDQNISAASVYLFKTFENVKQILKIQKDMNKTLSNLNGGHSIPDPSSFNWSDISGGGASNFSNFNWSDIFGNDSSSSNFSNFNWSDIFGNSSRGGSNFSNFNWSDIFGNTTNFTNHSSHRMLLSASSISSAHFPFPTPFEVYFNRTKELNLSSGDNTNPDSISGKIDSLKGNFQSNFIKYQKARKSCFEHLLKRFTKFVCIGCSATPGNFFLNSKLFLRKDFCSITQGACYEYLSLNELFSGFDDSAQTQILANETDKMLKTLTDIQSAFSDYAKNPATGLSSLAKAMQNLLKYQNSTSDIESITGIKYHVKRVPFECRDNQTCQYLCDTFLYLHGINQDVIINPGNLTYVGSPSRILQDSGSGVVYAENGFNVEGVTSGAETQVSFSQDPANTGSSVGGNGSFGNRLAVIVGAVFVAILCIL